MRKVKRNPFVLFFLIFMIAFGGAAAGMFFGFIMPEVENERIAKNGHVATATVLRISSTLEVNEVPYYKIIFEWENNNKTFVGKTNSAYTYSEAMRIHNKGTIEIKYIGKKATAADYKKQPGGEALWIVIVIFGVISIGSGVAAARSIISNKRNSALVLSGTAGTGTFLGDSVGVLVNGKPMHKITYSYVTESGEVVQKKTQSIYSNWEVDEIRRLKNFEIKYKGKQAVITQNLVSVASFAVNSENKQNNSSEANGNVRCDYCGVQNKKSAKKCTSCGAKL